MRLDVSVAAVALELASATGAGAAADERCDPLDPDLDGAHLIAHCYGYGYDLTLAQLLREFTRQQAVDYQARGLVLVNAAGRAGIAVGRGYVVEPAGGEYALTDPDPARWVAAYAPPLLIRSVVTG